jgi:hypothetical protein
MRKTWTTPGGRGPGSPRSWGRITLWSWADQFMSTVVHLRPTTV